MVGMGGLEPPKSLSTPDLQSGSIATRRHPHYYITTVLFGCQRTGGVPDRIRTGDCLIHNQAA